jgi:hypothetical protein
MQQSYYRKLRAQGYDIGTDETELVDFYLEAWNQLGRPMPVLEPMCGTGLKLIPFLEAGADVDGLDSSPYMLARCREKCAAQGLHCMLYEQFLEQMDLPRCYGLIFIPGGSYGHLYDKKVAAESLRRMHYHLLPGGWLALDVRPPASIDQFGKPGQVDYDLDEYDDGATVFTTGYWDHLDEGRVIRKWNKMERFVDDVLVETEVFDYRERLYDLEEMQSALRAAGFAEIRVTQAYEHDTPPSAAQDGMVFLARRR